MSDVKLPDGPPEMSPRDRIETLLPFYLNGTLDGDDLTTVEAWLATDPDATTTLAAAEAEHKASVLSHDALVAPDDALERFSKSLDAETRVPVRNVQGSLLATLWERLAGAPPGLAWGTAAAALALVVVQTITPLGLPGGQPEQVFTEAGAPQTVDEAPYVLVIFSPSADISALTGLLDDVGASIIGGPKPGGIYKVGVPATDVPAYERIVAQLKGAGLVDQVLPGRKPKGAE